MGTRDSEKLANLFKSRKLRFSRLTLCRRNNSATKKRGKRSSTNSSSAAHSKSTATAASTSKHHLLNGKDKSSQLLNNSVANLSTYSDDSYYHQASGNGGGGETTTTTTTSKFKIMGDCVEYKRLGSSQVTVMRGGMARDDQTSPEDNTSMVSLNIESSKLPVMEQFLRLARHGELASLRELVDQLIQQSDNSNATNTTTSGATSSSSYGLGDSAANKYTRLTNIREFDVNYRGKQKVYLGWTALHLACYFNKLEVAKYLLQVNISNREH